MSIDLKNVDSVDMIAMLNERGDMPEPDLTGVSTEKLLQALGMDPDDFLAPIDWCRFYDQIATGHEADAMRDFKKLVEKMTERILP